MDWPKIIIELITAILGILGIKCFVKWLKKHKWRLFIFTIIAIIITIISYLFHQQNEMKAQQKQILAVQQKQESLEKSLNIRHSYFVIESIRKTIYYVSSLCGNNDYPFSDRFYPTCYTSLFDRIFVNNLSTHIQALEVGGCSMIDGEMKCFSMLEGKSKSLYDQLIEIDNRLIDEVENNIVTVNGKEIKGCKNFKFGNINNKPGGTLSNELLAYVRSLEAPLNEITACSIGDLIVMVSIIKNHDALKKLFNSPYGCTSPECYVEAKTALVEIERLETLKEMALVEIENDKL